MPTLNEAAHVNRTLKPLQSLRDQGVEVIVVDGGSQDETCGMAAHLADQVVQQSGGRGAQLQRGALLATGDWLLFLHADTCLSGDAFRQLIKVTERQSHSSWGRFDLRLSGKAIVFRIIEKLINLRARVTSICTGDQGIFLKRVVLEQVGGVAQWPLLEDIELSQRLKQVSAPIIIKTPLVTSSRRWETHGVMKTILTMWLIRLGFSLGVSPVRLNRWYRPHAPQ